jgi:diacylglycerol kinase (ATP)
MIEDNRFSIAGRMRAFGYAIAGLIYAFKIGHAIWIQSAIAACVIVFGFYLQISSSDWRWIILAITLVWTTEIMNTAVETVCDALHPEHHNMIGVAKDAAAGAVLMAAIGAVVIGTLTFWPYLF